MGFTTYCYASFLVLGGAFLCVTGAEALYADMGHFGARPIRLAWSGLVLPSLILNYAGQSAIVLDGAPVTDNILYRLCPELLLIPFVILATIATIGRRSSSAGCGDCGSPRPPFKFVDHEGSYVVQGVSIDSGGSRSRRSPRPPFAV
jgi:hypothetical protein